MSRITSYPVYFAERARIRYPSAAERIYSNVDPSREWTGEGTLEFTESADAATTTFISGGTRTRRALSMAARVPTEEIANSVGEALRDFIKTELEELKTARLIIAWTMDPPGVLADARGLAIGESFYCYIDFSITEQSTLLEGL